jgi:outer membrane protein OmpA-like peptidoglycan-associated protein
MAHRHKPLLSLLLAAAPLVALALAPREAQAQQYGYTADRLILAPNPDDGFATMRPSLHERTRFFGNLTLDYIRRPLKTKFITSDGATQQTFSSGILSNQANGNATIGGEFLGRFSLSATLPFTFVNTTGVGDSPTVRGKLDSGVQLNSAAAGDLRLDGRVLFYQTDSKSFSVGASGTVFLGTGNEISFAGDGSTHSLFQALVEQRAGGLIFNEYLGIHLRQQNDLGGKDGLHFANELVFGGGVFIPLRDGRVRVGGEIFGSTGASTVTYGETKIDTFFKSHYTPVEWLGEVKIALDEQKQAWFNGGAGTVIAPGYSAPDFRVVAQIGYWFEIRDTNPPSPVRTMKVKDEERVEEKASDIDGDGIPDAIDKCPTVPEDGQPPDPNDGCPMPKDRDHDGIPDDVDKCPDEPEDRDGFEDEDGCPELDNDKDGIPDVQDACPREPGQPSPDPKQNGCPQFIRRVEGSNEIQILKKIEFDTGKATIKSGSLPILDEVVRLLQVNQNIAKLSVEGHTDNRGSAQMNTKLSQDRSESVVKYLISKGVAADRLSAKGFGPDKPIEDNKTEPGRAKNRRVEFHIVEQR